MTIEVPAGTQNGQRFRLRKRGVPRPGGEGRGDLWVEARVVGAAPSPTNAAAALLRELRTRPRARRAASTRPRAAPAGGAERCHAGRRASPRPRRSRARGRARYYMISVVSKAYGIHPQTLRLYEREGLLKPSRTEGNTRLYSEEDLRQLEVILNLTRDLGVNLAGVEIVLNMRRRMEQMQQEVNEFVGWVRQELGSRGAGRLAGAAAAGARPAAADAARARRAGRAARAAAAPGDGRRRRAGAPPPRTPAGRDE